MARFALCIRIVKGADIRKVVNPNAGVTTFLIWCLGYDDVAVKSDGLLLEV